MFRISSCLPKKSCLLICLLCAFAALPASADMCTIDQVPAATLLLPYFEVDTAAAPGAGVNTLLRINNAAPEPALGQVTFWTNWGVPVVSYNIFLTGYDVVTIDLYDMIVNGNIPITADLQSDPENTISPGPPEWDGSFQVCDQIFPLFINPVIFGSIAERVLNGLTGKFTNQTGGCMAEDFGDLVARGYVTIDRVQKCSVLFPSNDGYFHENPLFAVASTENQLWGDSFLFDPATGALESQPLVHIEALDTFNADNGILDPSVPTNPTNYTFYGRYTQAEGGVDHREPLGTVWGVGYLSGGGGIDSDLTIWRDPTQDTQADDYVCGSGGPDWNPLGQTQVVCFNEQEELTQLCEGEKCFPLATQRVGLNNGGLTPPYESGWCYLNLNSDDEITSDVDFPQGTELGGTIRQSYVGTYGSTGLSLSGLSVVELKDACEDSSPVLTHPAGIFQDSFESGDLTFWSMIIGL